MLLILASLFPLSILDEVLGALTFVPVPLPLAEMTDVFITVGMAVLMSTH
jgi:hypothetical protein